MLGAILGDLAAWTYENDRDTFWKQLVSNNSKDIELSVYGHAYFRAASRNVWSVPEQDVAYINNVSSTKYTLEYSKLSVI